MLPFFNLILSATLIIFPFYLINKDKENFYLGLLYLFHLSFFIINFFYKDYFASDVNGYLKWSVGQNGSAINGMQFQLGKGASTITYIVEKLTYFKIETINMHLLFSQAGFYGLFLFYKLINKFNNNIINKLIFFTPSWHFYTSNVGKDSLICLLLGLCLLFYDNRKIIYFFITVLFIYLIRPNVSILFSTLLIFLFLNVFFQKYHFYLRKNFNIKILFSSGVIITLLFVFIYIIDFHDKFNDVLSFIKQRQTYFYLGNTGYMVGEYNFLKSIFYYLFMPLGINLEKNIFYFYQGLENTLLLIFVLYSIFSFNYKKIKIFSLEIFLLLFICMFLFLVSIVNTNLGLSGRQKWMILPFFFYIFSIYSNYSIFSKK